MQKSPLDGDFWLVSGWWDLNPRPHAPRACALATTLQPVKTKPYKGFTLFSLFWLSLLSF